MIEVSNLNKTYDRRRRNANHVLHDVSFSLPDTGFVCILGPSGCGKTSLLNAMGGLDVFDNGTLSSGDTTARRYGTKAYEALRNRDFGYIFQNYYLLPEHSVAYNIYLGLHSLHLSHREKLKRIRSALAAVDMSRYLRRKVGELSGGQQQRIAIARALARQPRVIFADEPTGNLDEANTMNICTLLRKISKTSLVIMVTHEERIAKFFADRIIRLDGGRVASNEEVQAREHMTTGTDKELYAGDYRETVLTQEGISLRFLQEEGAAPVELTVVALENRIVIKLADRRATTCTDPGAVPVLREGPRPLLTLETVDSIHADTAPEEPPAGRTRAGRGIPFSMMLREAVALGKGKGAKMVSMRLFLLLLTALTMWTACDFLTVASVDPRDFITTDSHILEVKLKRGNAATEVLMDSLHEAYREHVKASGLEVEFLPQVAAPASYSSDMFYQLGSVQQLLTGFSYVPRENLLPEQLVLGRMPETLGEIVLDRWLLDKMLAEDSIVSNTVVKLENFLGEQIYFEKRGVYLEIVGISDTGEPALFVSKSMLLYLVGQSNPPILGLSDLQASFPGEYDDITLSEGECVVNQLAVSGSMADSVGKTWNVSGQPYKIKRVIEASTGAALIFADTELDWHLEQRCTSRYYLYCQDKAAMREYLSQPLPEELEGKLIVDIIDHHTDATNEYQEASRVKLDARLIVTVTVMALSLMMLYLLCRAQARERIGMMAVYRLLGIPKGKLAGIFAMESVLESLRTALPTAVAVHLAVNILTAMEDVDFEMVLPWQATLAVYGGILVYHILVSLLPLRRLLRLPPAQLAAKYDF